jgi:hypothetical protein
MTTSGAAAAADDKAAIEGALSSYNAALNGGDTAAVLPLYTEDGIFMSPYSQSAIGRDELPFGTIYSSNITADPESGIGNWSDEEFVRAVREGVRKDGAHLYLDHARRERNMFLRVRNVSE